MVAIVERCHGCGTKRRSMEQRFCAKCGAELPSAPEPEAPPPSGGLAWNYRVPIINNRYAWVRWGWAALAFGGGFAAVLGTLIVVMFAANNGGVGFAIKVYLAIGLISGAVVIGAGFLSALGAGNDLAMAFALGPEGAMARVSEEEMESIENAGSFFAGRTADAHQNAQIAALLLPPDGDAKWKDVRRAQFDDARRVITLRRRWHNPLRLYVPAERWDCIAAYVRSHTTSGAEPGA